MSETTDSPRPTCRVVRSTGHYHGKQGFEFHAAISAESVGSQQLCMHLQTVPPGARAKAHLHQDHETAIYVLSGSVRMLYGEQLEQELSVTVGDFLFIPAGVPHLPFNASDSEPATALLARSDPNEQESVVLRPDLDALVAEREGSA